MTGRRRRPVQMTRSPAAQPPQGHAERPEGSEAMTDRRQDQIVEILADAFAPLIEVDPRAFRRKFRKMATDPFTFYRGSACVFYADVAAMEDRWADERTGQVWIQG